MLAAQPLRPASDQARVRLSSRPLAAEGQANQQKPDRQVHRHRLGSQRHSLLLSSITLKTTAHTSNMAPDQPETRNAPERSSTAPIAEVSTTTRRRHHELLIFEDNQVSEASRVTGQGQQDPTELRSSSTLDQRGASESRHDQGGDSHHLAARTAQVVPEEGAEHDHRTQHEHAADVAEDLQTAELLGLDRGADSTDTGCASSRRPVPPPAAPGLRRRDDLLFNQAEPAGFRVCSSPHPAARLAEIFVRREWIPAHGCSGGRPALQ